MPTIKAGNITKGSYIIFRDAPCLVTKAEFYHPGKGSAVNRVKFRNLKTGATQDFTFKSNEQVEVADVTSREMQYLYMDGNDVVFMDPRDFDQVTISASLFPEKVAYLMPDLKVYVLFYNEDPIGVNFPPKVTLTVTYAEDATAGNRVNAPKKPVTVETGAEIQAPIFVKTSDKIVIDTETGEYVSRAN